MHQNGYIFCLASSTNPTIVKVDWIPMSTPTPLDYKDFKGLVSMRESARGNAGWKIVVAKYNVANPKLEYNKLIDFLNHVHIQPEVGLYFASYQVINRYFDRVGGDYYNHDS